jgi:ABC-type bacteriocin/lantibiotic exporter with double-glycine peptidase domain
MYGDKVDGKKLARLADTTAKNGTDDWQLDTAARELGFRLVFRVLRTMDEAYVALRADLRHDTPVLLCIDYCDNEMSHWVAAVHGNSRHVWICDPEMASVEQRLTWRRLLRRWHYGLPDEIRFYAYSVVPL